MQKKKDLGAEIKNVLPVLKKDRPEFEWLFTNGFQPLTNGSYLLANGL